MGKMWRLGVVLVLISLGSCIHGKKTGPEDITITTTALPDGTIGEAYTAKLEATRRHKGIDLSWSLEGGSLPNGLIMNANGYITGVPTKSGTFEFIVKVVDNYDQNKDVKNLSITITGMQITTTSLPDGVVGVAYIQTLQVAGGGGASLTWSIASGALPDGLSLAASSGIINGLPSKEGTFSFVARVVDTNNNEASKALSITIAPSPITITTTSTTLPNGRIGSAYSEKLQATGSATIAWSLVNSTLPSGLTLDANGTISGVPQTAGNYSFIAKATDTSTGVHDTETISLIIMPIEIMTNSALPVAVVGASYEQQLMAKGGFLPLSWSVYSGNLPDGLQLSTDGLISGVATVVGSFAFGARVSDASGNSSTKMFSLEVTSSTGPLTILTNSPLGDMTVGKAYSVSFTSNRTGSANLEWTVSAGSLPSGLTLTSSGSLIGSPESASENAFVVRVKDLGTNETAEKSFTLKVNTFTFTPTGLPLGNVGSSYTQTFTTDGGFLPVTWSVTSGSLPDGLDLDASGIIAGIPTTVGTYVFVITAKDSKGNSASRAYTLVIN